jgi:methionyl-tRNA synthetase
VLILVERQCDSVIPPFVEEDSFVKGVSGLPERVTTRMDAYQLHAALAEIWQTIADANKYVDDPTPWQISDKATQGTAVYNLLEALRYVAIVLHPFMPETAAPFLEQLGLEPRFSFQDLTGGGLQAGNKIHRGNFLFPKQP